MAPGSLSELSSSSKRYLFKVRVSPANAQSAQRGRRNWHDGIPPILRPLVRAYLLGYVSAVAPRVLTLLLKHIRRRRHISQTGEKTEKTGKTGKTAAHESWWESLQHILYTGLDPRRFPAFCALIVGGSTLLEVPLKVALNKLTKNLSEVARKRLSRWFASFIAAYLSLRLLQSKQSASFVEVAPVQVEETPGAAFGTTRSAGRTLDLTLFAVTRALDIIVGSLWARRQTTKKPSAVSSAISHLPDTALFAVSSGLIMWNWIYHPSRLPHAYNKWIDAAAAIDHRLVEALRRCRTGALQYGVDTGQAPLLGSMCDDYGWPRAWGDPAVSVPFPCEVVHMGTCGSSCEGHAAARFVRSFRWAMATYLPLNLVAAAVRSQTAARPGPYSKEFRRALISAARSSAFLGAFISLFYYSICLTRSRLGPHILGKDAKARQKIDGGMCIGAGCVLCGWSILLENAGRHKDVALFVAPRALATLLPRRYAWEKQWRETVVFAASTAVVFTCVLEDRARVRGVLGSVLGSVLQP
ncbi:integral membrane protein [Lasiosphaeris hirsuta]|uniref:Integral membrane protein n=1 Tax=Lasiosphaeris hirsuta TaxID=260670 RepID=A0AA39ZX48_9PEZI|nr:integral membrane protein [Lasiosphaeris hirsuta]